MGPISGFGEPFRCLFYTLARPYDRRVERAGDVAFAARGARVRARAIQAFVRRGDASERGRDVLAPHFPHQQSREQTREQQHERVTGLC